MRAGQLVGRRNANPTKLFSVNYYDLKSISFKFGNAICNTFEMPRSSYLMFVGKFTFCCYSVHLLQRALSICIVLHNSNKVGFHLL